VRRLSVGFALAAVAIFALLGAALATAARPGEGEAIEAGAPATKEATTVCTEAEVETEAQAEAVACAGEEVEAEEEVSAEAEASGQLGDRLRHANPPKR
jgi:hypothetical protein